MTFTCKSCEGECKYAVAPPVCPLCLVGGQWHDRDETEKPITTAYDRAQAELVRRIEALESRDSAAELRRKVRGVISEALEALGGTHTDAPCAACQKREALQGVLDQVDAL